MQHIVALVLDRVRVCVGQDFQCQLILFCDMKDLTLRSMKRFCNQARTFLIILLMISDFIVSNSFDFRV